VPYAMAAAAIQPNAAAYKLEARAEGLAVAFGHRWPKGLSWVGAVDLPAVRREVAQIESLALTAGGHHQHRRRHVGVALLDGLPEFPADA
jgi:hypothetical protein